jgi:DNA-binding beta-propeller fold protein YncE
VRELERRFERELVVIGVHSGKFRAERITTNIAQAAQRLGVGHPVVNDRQYRVWRAFGVNAWPTLVLIDAIGGIAAVQPGEIQADDLAPAVYALIGEADAEGIMDRSPLALTPATEPGLPLRFPGKLLALPGGRLFVADSGHDRILEAQVEVECVREALATGGGAGGRATSPVPAARVLRVIGSSRRGNADGPLAEARFDHPQGMAFAPASSPQPSAGWLQPVAGAPLAAGTLYVADAGNHTLRSIDLAAGDVTTLAGTGRQARRFNVPGIGTGAALSSPWDLALVSSSDGRPAFLIVAMAGTHQLWRADLTTLAVEPWAGTGREDITDGPAFRTTLAQPMGLSLAGRRLYFADAESSAVRFAEPATDPQRSPEVTTLIGRGLFEFGDADGQGGHARLQHPYQVSAHAGSVYVADTYNNKIKRLDPATKRVETFLGSGEEGAGDGDAAAAAFDEPQGLTVADDILYVADTNNHALRAADLRASRPRVVTLAIVG